MHFGATSHFNENLLSGIRALIKSGYFSLDVEGGDYVKSTKSGVYIGNHAGWFTLDTFIAALAYRQASGRRILPSGFAHDLLLKTPLLKNLFKDSIFLPASYLKYPERIPKEIKNFAIMPEGESGNCKPFWRAYHMRPWHRGFVRLAIYKQIKIVPAAIIGGEECMPTLETVEFLKPFIGSPIPIPLSLFPLPTHWKVIFHPPIDMSVYPKSTADDPVKCKMITREIQNLLQATLDQETAHRPLRHLSAMVDRWFPDHFGNKQTRLTEKKPSYKISKRS